MKRHRAIAGGLAVIVLAAVAGLLAKTSQTVKTGQQEVPLARVQRGDLDIKVYATGELRATHTMVLTAPPVGGGALQITRLLHTGAAVKKGDIVFEFDPAEQRYNLEQSRSELLQAQQEIAKAHGGCSRFRPPRTRWRSSRPALPRGEPSWKWAKMNWSV